MKESWMEKLIELLNEFEIEKPARDYTWRIEKQNETRLCWTEYTWAYIDDEEAERIIISKKYKFIEWLVQNDKIDKYKVIELEHNWIRPFKLDNLYWEIKLEERLLMLLSIQDTPIDFLTKIIK